MIMWGGAELTDTLQNTILLYGGVTEPESAPQEWDDVTPF
jgi:hypothetical protein